jgi:hypothetical protein
VLVIGEIIIAARDEHPLFTRDRHPDRVCVTYLSERHRHYYKQLADEMRDRLSQAVTVAAVISGQLVGVDPAGIPFPAPAGGDGYAVFVGADTVPYLGDFLVASDPFADGFALPAESIQIIGIWADLPNERLPIHWQTQPKQARFQTGEGLEATVNGWRLSPIKNPPQARTLWDQVTAIIVAYVPAPAEFDTSTAAVLEQEISIPTSYGHVLKWELAAMMARHELALDPKAFPTKLADFFEGKAKEVRGEALEGARLDHRTVKVHRMGRNR